MAWLITFTTYGTHFHHPPPLARWEHGQLSTDIYLLDDRRRPIVLAAVLTTCALEHWALIAAHIRTNHAHLIVEGPDSHPDSLVSRIKSESSRQLSRQLGEGPLRRWTRSASLLRVRNIERVFRYVTEGQGQPMSLYVRPV